MNWRLWTRGDFIAILLVIAVLGAIFLVSVNDSSLGRTSHPRFGPEWTCTYPGYGGPVCVKKTLSKSDELNYGTTSQ